MQSDIAVEAAESVTLTAAQKIAITGAGVLSLRDQVILTLQAPYVSLGQKFLEPGATSSALTSATIGTGSVIVKSSALIDVGNLVVRGGENRDARRHGGRHHHGVDSRRWHDARRRRLDAARGPGLPAHRGHLQRRGGRHHHGETIGADDPGGAAAVRRRRT
ncbi:MAG: hypothetical protein WDM96_09715 [Lacunisphaera sp.]